METEIKSDVSERAVADRTVEAWEKVRGDFVRT